MDPVFKNTLKNTPEYLKYLIIIALSGILFFPFLGNVHLFDWDEINFAECAREMIVSKDYLRAQIDFMPFWEKPPLFIWMQVVSMKMFGVGAFAARFPNAFIGVCTLVSLFYVGKKVTNEQMAKWWVLLYVATWLPHFYLKSGIIDPTFNFFIFLAFFQLYLQQKSPARYLHSILAGLFLGLAVLTKGPVAILVAGISFVVFLILNKGLSGLKVLHLLLIALFVFVPFFAWTGLAYQKFGAGYGKWFLNEFISYQIRLFSTEDSDHGGPFFYHFVVLLVGCFPASLFLFQYRLKQSNPDNSERQTNFFTRLMWILFWVVLILFSIVKTKIVHYSSLCYFPLTYLAALQLSKINDSNTVKTRVKGLLLFTGTVLAILITALPVIGLNKEKIIPYINDPFAVGNLGADVAWSYAECLPGIIYLAGIWISVLMIRKQFQKGMMLLCALQIIMIQITVLHFTPKIEAYSQRAAIDFYEKFQGQDVYIHPMGFKSYANLFYSAKNPAKAKEYYNINRTDEHGMKLPPEANQDWLLNGNIDRPAYFVCKIQGANDCSKMSQLIEVGRSNGFVFYKRR